MSDSDLNFFEEPKKVFTNMILIPRLSEVETMIYVGNRPSKAIRPMRGIIDSLNKNDQKKLAKLREKLANWELDPSSATRFAIEDVFRELSEYLHKTYLKGHFVQITKKDFEVLEKEASK